MITIKNEPNLRQTNPIQTNRLLSCPAVRPLSTYSGQALRKKCCASSSLRPKHHTVSKPRTKKCETNPILQKPPKNTQKTGKAPKSTCAEPVEVQLFTTFHASTEYLFRAKSIETRATNTERRATKYDQQMKKMQNEPNLKNTKINLNPVKTKNYMKNDAFSPPKNEPNLRKNKQ